MSSDPKGNQAIPSSSAVPDSNTLLAFKLLSDSWKEDNDGNIFNKLMKEEMKYLVSGISLLQNDPYLQVKLGGVNLNNAGYLANALKSKVSELELRERIEPSAKNLLKQQYSASENLKSLAPDVASGRIKENAGILGIGFVDRKGVKTVSSANAAIKVGENGFEAGA